MGAGWLVREFASFARYYLRLDEGVTGDLFGCSVVRLFGYGSVWRWREFGVGCRALCCFSVGFVFEEDISFGRFMGRRVEE